MIDRIFWATCPKCGTKFYCDYSLRFAAVKLICPGCSSEFEVKTSPEIDERWHASEEDKAKPSKDAGG